MEVNVQEEAMLYIWELGGCFVKTLLQISQTGASYCNWWHLLAKSLEPTQTICRAARVGQYLPSMPRLYAKRIQTYLYGRFCAQLLKFL